MRIGVLVVVALVGCQPMYGDPPQKLKNPKVAAGSGSGSAEPPKKQYIDKCGVTNFRVPVPPKGAPRDIPAAQDYVIKGDSSAVKADDPQTTADQKRDLILSAIDMYQRALAKDPYDVDATLNLALLYDRTLRKGCAIQMLKRLEALANHKSFQQLANSAKQRVRDNQQMFADYRDEALREIP